MKALSRMVVLFFVIIGNLQLFAQTENTAVVSGNNMKIFYIGIDNPITVAVPGISNDKISVIIKNGTITGSNGNYNVKVSSGSESIISVVTSINSGETKIVGTDTFKISRVPDPTPCIGDYCTSTFSLSKDELLKYAEVNVSVDLPYDLKFEITSFTFSKLMHTSSLVEFTATGNKFTQEMINAISDLKAGDKIYFENIKAKCPDGSFRSLSSIIITII
jgi:gliding motility-associated protein GldM